MLHTAPWYLPCRVMRVIDGDTFDCQIILAGKAFGLPTVTDRIRLADLNIWEVRGEEKEKGLKAKIAVEEWIGNGFPLWLATDGERELARGKYGRLIADLRREDGSSLVKHLRELDGGVHIKSSLI